MVSENVIGEIKCADKRIKSIDILKGIAMLMVVLVHFNQSFPVNNVSLFRFGQMGCQIFFVVSGFGIAKSFEKAIANNSLTKASMSFYYTRFLNIAPAYYLMMLVVYLVNTLSIVMNDSTLTFGTNRNTIAILCNVLFIHGVVPTANNTVMPGGWYIGTTMMLYLITPILFLIFRKFERIRKICCMGISVISVSVLIFMSMVFPDYQSLLLNNNSFGYYSGFTQLPSFCIGMFLYFESKEMKLNKKMAKINLFSGIVLMLGAMSLFFFPITKYAYIIDASIVGISTYFILKFMLYYEETGEYNQWFEPVIRFGKKSFYIYLVHPFFAWSFVSLIRDKISCIGIDSDTYVCFFSIMPMVILLSYFFGNVLQKTVTVISKHSFKAK